MKIGYVELPAADAAVVGRMEEFYGGVMGWSFEDWGPEYAAFSEAGVAGGVNGGGEHRTAAPLVVVETDDLKAAERAVQDAGGVITLAAFDYPGGRRSTFVIRRGTNWLSWCKLEALMGAAGLF